MGILSWIVLGLVVGVLAKWIMPGKDPGGLFITIILGIAGAMLGGFFVFASAFGVGPSMVEKQRRPGSTFA